MARPGNILTEGPQPFTANPGQSAINGGRAAGVVDNGLVGVGHDAQVFAVHAQNQAEENETRDALVQTHELRAKYMKQLQDANNSGADVSKIQENFSDDQQNIYDNLSFKGSSKAAKVAGTESSMLFAAHANQINAEREGAAAKQSVIRSLASNGEMLQMAPDAVQLAIEAHNTVIDTFAGRIPPHVLDALKTEGAQKLTLNSVEQMIRTTPNVALDLLQNPKDNDIWKELTPEMRIAAQRDAQAMLNAQRADAEHARVAAEREKVAHDKAFFDSMLTDHGEGKGSEWTQTRILTSDVAPEMKTHMAGVLKALNDDKKTDKANWAGAARAIVANVMTRAEFDQLFIHGDFDPEEYKAGLSLMAALDKPEGHAKGEMLKASMGAIDPKGELGKVLNPNGSINSFKFQQDLEGIEAQFRKQGKDNDIINLYTYTTPEFAKYTAPLIEKYRFKGPLTSTAPFAAAEAAAGKVSPSEQAMAKVSEGGQPNAPGMVMPGNIDLTKRKVLNNPDGSISTESSITIGVNVGGKNVFMVIPTVVDGKRLSNDEAVAYAKKTRQHLGMFNSQKAADDYAQGVHEQQDKRYSKPAESGIPGMGAKGAIYETNSPTLSPTRQMEGKPSSEHSGELARAAAKKYPHLPIGAAMKKLQDERK